MHLTFKGFLRNYCRELSGLETDNIRKLARSSATDAPRVAEPLFLFALEQHKLGYLLEVCTGTWMEEGFRALADTAASYPSAYAFAESSEAPERFRKVRDAYLSQRDATERDRRLNALMRKKTLAAMAEKGLTAYRLCKELDLNMGNVYAYLGKGDASKVSRETARLIMEHATR